MQKFLQTALISGFLTLLISPSQAQLNLTTGQTAQQLVTTLTGPGLLATNISGQFLSNSAATFANNGVVGFNLTGGIILSSGLVTLINDPAVNLCSDLLSQPGDSLLDQIVAPYLTHDASSIEFDFSATNDSVEFNFVFASEEYNDFVNSPYNDIFAFFITGPGFLPNTNVALLPGTTTPITINNVNNGNSPVLVTATGPCTNCSYYVDNVGTNAIDLNYDGFTTTIKIKFPVWPCANYHFKISIADVSDEALNSAVLLEENSFIPCPAMQANHHGIATDSVYICAGGSATLTAPPGAQYSWNTAATTQSIVVTQPGTYSFMITDPSQPACFSFSNSITVVQAGTIQTPIITQTNNQLEALNVIPAPGISWQWFLNGTPIIGATQNTYVVTSNGCYTVAIYEGSCESTSNEICVTNTSLNELLPGSINIYPHPVINTSFIETPFKEGSFTSLKIKDVNGREVFAKTERQGRQLQLDKGAFRSGVYFLEISNSEYQGTIVRKIIIR